MAKHSHNFIDLTGQVFGRLTIIKQVLSQKPKQVRWLCLCECGIEIETYGVNLRTGDKRSCGCLRRDIVTAKNRTADFIATHTTHGISQTPEYMSWRGMISRCYNPNDISYANYGGRGIKVCHRWHDVTNFLADMGQKPSIEMQIERIDNNDNYCPRNCRWATRLEQARNKSNNVLLTYQGKTRHIAEWARVTGIHSSVIRERMIRGWPPEIILSARKYHKSQSGTFLNKQKLI